MPLRVSFPFTIEIEPGLPVALRDIEHHREELQRAGIYLLHDGPPTGNAFDPVPAAVVYIGKAIRETIYSRCSKHRRALQGDPSMRPGKNFRGYRSKVPDAVDRLYVIPGFMNAAWPYLISGAEEYLLLKYADDYTHGPCANTT